MENKKGRPKGGKNKYWSAEEKYKVIEPIIKYEKTSGQVTKETGISNGMLSKWVNNYKNEGMKGLENKKKPGNTLIKYSVKKNLTETEKLEYENMKLRIENER